MSARGLSDVVEPASGLLGKLVAAQAMDDNVRLLEPEYEGHLYRCR